MDIVLESIREGLQKFNLVPPVIYTVERFTIGHSQLVLRCSTEKKDSRTPEQVCFIKFDAVRYFQLVPYWRNIPITVRKLSNSDSQLKFIRNSTYYYVYSVNSPEIDLKIISSTLPRLFSTMPPIID